jgi:quercetin dioxygenase-like cupin family protein
MAYRNKVINNPKTGQSISFLQSSGDTKGELLEMESSFRPFSKEPPPHYHPYQVEDFQVLAGELKVRSNGTVATYKKNETFHIPADTIHSMWNCSEETTVVNWKVRPALTTENLFETIFGLSNEGKTNVDGMPAFLQTVLIANNYSNVYRAAKPPYFLQKLIFIILTPFSYLLGYRPNYKKYLD